MNYNKGFTLIELLIVVIIAGTLFFVGLPAYQNSVLKSNRVVGKGILAEVSSRQEQYFINHKTYTDDLTNLGYVSDPFYVDDQADAYSSLGNRIYQIDLGLASLVYTVTATPRNRQAKDTQCGTFSLTSRGVKSVTGGSGVSECW